MRIRLYPQIDETGHYRFVPEERLEREVKAVPQFISDEMEPTQHPCDQKYYTSKSEFRRVTRAHGKIEVGNEWDAFMSMKPTHQTPPVSENIKNALLFHEAIAGKSESERREIEKRFYTDDSD